MIKIPYEDILQKITEKTSTPREEIEVKIQAKLKQFAGLISQEGAAHIIANELGVKIIEAPVGGKLAIKNILSGMRSVDTVGKVINMMEPRTFQSGERSGSVASMTIGDETGTIRIVAWGDQTKNWATIKEGDIVKILGAYTKDNNNQKEIHLNDRAKLIINPPGETVGEVVAPPSQSGPARKKISEIDINDSNVELCGVIVQAFDPRFFEVCGQCGKRVRDTDGIFNCPAHGQVTPEFSYVTSVVLDDGSETIRISCFRQQVEQLLSKSSQEILVLKDTPESLVDLRQSIIGKIMTFVGRARKNEVLDRMEFIAQSVDNSPKPEEELKRLANSQQN